MNCSIREFAQNRFKNENIITTPKDIYLDMDYEPWEMQNIFANINLQKTNWKNTDFSIDGFKNYDNDGNSFWVGILLIKAQGKNKDDFLQFADTWDKAENHWYDNLNSF